MKTLTGLRSGVAALGVVATVLSLSACVGASPVSPVPSPGTSSAATATPSVPALGKGITLKSTTPVDNGHGEYLQTSIADSDPAMEYNPDIADAASKEHFAAEDITAAQRKAMRFAAEEGLDSILNDGDDVDAWWAANKDKFYSGQQDNIKAIFTKELIATNENAVVSESWMRQKYPDGDYGYIYGPDKVRIASRTITPSSIVYGTTQGLDLLKISAYVDWSSDVKLPTGGTGVQKGSGFIWYTMVKENGEWKIAGLHLDEKTTEAQ